MAKTYYKNVMQCDICNNSGIEIYKEDGEIKGRRCDCHNQRLALVTLETCGMKESVAKFRFENFETKEPYQSSMAATCKKFLAQTDQKFLFISGQPGTGKTHIGTATCRTFIGRGLPTLYTTYLTLMNVLKANINENEYNDVLQKYADIELLYIDDFMKHEPSKSDIAHTFELINLRNLADKITIITSERTIEEIIDIDEALGGRIKQQCGEFAISIARKPGRDWRLRE